MRCFEPQEGNVRRPWIDRLVVFPLLLLPSHALGQPAPETSIEPATQAAAGAPASATEKSALIVGSIEPIYIDAKKQRSNLDSAS